MQKIDTAQDLQSRLSTVLEIVEREFKPLTDEQLRWKPAPNRWSIIECLQHLNLAECFYIRNIQHKIGTLSLSPTNSIDQSLESDWIGKIMLYSVDPQVKMKLPAPGMIRPRPGDELLPHEVMRQFVELQSLLNTLLNKAIYLDWNAEKVMTLFGNWLKIRLGDALLMLVSHTERHIKQAIRVKAEMDTFALKN